MFLLVADKLTSEWITMPWIFSFNENNKHHVVQNGGLDNDIGNDENNNYIV